MPHDGQPAQIPPVLRDAGDNDSDLYVIGVRESTDPHAWSLLLMECDDDADTNEDGGVDERERDDGMDTYCLVVDPGQATHYGGIIECELTGTELRLVLTQDAATALGMPTHTRFALDLAPHQREMLGRGLQRVLTVGRTDTITRLLHV